MKSLQKLVLAVCLFSLLGFVSQAADPPPEVAKLISQLKNPDASVRLKAAKDLGKLKEKAKAAITPLRDALKDEDEDVRAVAKNALAAISEAPEVEKDKDADIVAPFVEKLKSKKESEKIEALVALGSLGEKGLAGSGAIAEMLLDPTPSVREAAASSLEKVDKTIYKHVITMLYDNNGNNKAAAVDALNNLGSRAKGALPILKYIYSSSLAAIPANQNPRLRKKIPDYRSFLALVAIAPADPFVVDEVLRLVSQPGQAIVGLEDSRAYGLASIDKITANDAKKVKALTAGLVDPRHRVLIIQRLAKFAGEAKPALPLLTKLKLDSDAAVRDAATKAIETIKGD